MSDKYKKRIENRLSSRRQFLVGSSAFLTLPPLLSLMSKQAYAQAMTTKKVRSIIYTGMLGIDPHQWLPSNAADLSSLITVPGAIHTRYKKLNTFANPISRVIDSSFAPMFPYMNVMQGLSLTGGYYQGHNTCVLAGSHSGFREPIFGKTIDVIMEQSSNVYKSGEYVPHKALRIHSGGMSFDRVNGVVLPSGSLQGDTAVFNKLFGSLPSTSTTADPKITQFNNNKKLIVDKVYDDLKKLEKNSRLSSEDKNTLSRYVASMFDLQVRVNASLVGGGPTCSKPVFSLDATTKGNFYQFPHDPAWGVADVSAMFDNYLEMIKLAFECDLTRVVHMTNTMWSNAPISPDSDGGLHHECASSELAADRQQWGIKKMLKLAEKLQATPDTINGGGSLLDNSSILCTNELGSWTAAHSIFSMPAIMFGSGGGFFKTGNFVDYTQRPTTTMFGSSWFSPGRPYKQLLQSIMQSMGVPKSEYMLYGDGLGFGEFKEGINQFGKVTKNTYTPYINEHNDVLPFVT